MCQIILSIFASRDLCESTFIWLKFIKNNQGSDSANKNQQYLHGIAVSTEPVDIDLILKLCERFWASISKF